MRERESISVTKIKRKGKIARERESKLDNRRKKSRRVTKINGIERKTDSEK